MVIGPLSYLVISLNMPLIDAPLRQIDSAFAFNWAAQRNFIMIYPVIMKILNISYTSIYWQMFVIVGICSTHSLPREKEFVRNYALCLTVCIVIGGILPALGPPSLFWPVEPAEFEAIRSGGWHLFDYRTMQGLIAFPSIHAAFSILAVYAVRHSLPGLIGLGMLNVFMLASTPIIGGHYLIDVIGGGIIAGASILCVRKFNRWRIASCRSLHPIGSSRVPRARQGAVPRASVWHRVVRRTTRMVAQPLNGWRL